MRRIWYGFNRVLMETIDRHNFHAAYVASKDGALSIDWIEFIREQLKYTGANQLADMGLCIEEILFRYNPAHFYGLKTYSWSLVAICLGASAMVSNAWAVNLWQAYILLFIAIGTLSELVWGERRIRRYQNVYAYFNAYGELIKAELNKRKNESKDVEIPRIIYLNNECLRALGIRRATCMG